MQCTQCMQQCMQPQQLPTTQTSTTNNKAIAHSQHTVFDLQGNLRVYYEQIPFDSQEAHH